MYMVTSHNGIIPSQHSTNLPCINYLREVAISVWTTHTKVLHRRL